jgi:hypothetical protein
VRSGRRVWVRLLARRVVRGMPPPGVGGTAEAGSLLLASVWAGIPAADCPMSGTYVAAPAGAPLEGPAGDGARLRVPGSRPAGSRQERKSSRNSGFSPVRSSQACAVLRHSEEMGKQVLAGTAAR